MTITLYGLIVFIALFTGFSFINIINRDDILLIILILIISICLQFYLCNSCYNSYSLASYLTTIPILLVLLFECKKLKEAIFIFSIICAIGRIGCYFASCCSGKITSKKPYTINYSNYYLINKTNHKEHISVYPTIIIEIIIQFIIAYLVYYNSYGIILYGILYIIWYDKPLYLLYMPHNHRYTLLTMTLLLHVSTFVMIIYLMI